MTLPTPLFLAQPHWRQKDSLALASVDNARGGDERVEALAPPGSLAMQLRETRLSEIAARISSNAAFSSNGKLALAPQLLQYLLRIESRLARYLSCPSCPVDLIEAEDLVRAVGRLVLNVGIMQDLGL